MEEKKQKKGRLKGFFTDFKNFISKGNIIDLAVAVVIGTAFTKIVNSLVADIIMPFIGLVIGKNNIADAKWQITADLSLNWGTFVMAIIDFLIIAFFVFLVIRIIMHTGQGLSKISRKARKELGLIKESEEPKEGETPVLEEAKEETKEETLEDILRDIRNLLVTKVKSDEKDAE